MKFSDQIYLTLSSQRYTPYNLAKKLNAIAILESASFTKGRQRYSILMIKKAFTIVQEKDDIEFIVEGERIPYGKINPVDYRTRNPDILDALDYVASQNPDAKEISGNDIPLPGSGIGFLSYEFARHCDNIKFQPQEDELNIPESEFVVGHIYIVFDHFTEQLHIFALNYKEHKIDLEKEVENLKKKLNDMDFSYIQEENETYEHEILTDEAKSKAEYIAKIEALKKHIIDGDIIQAVPSRRLQIKSEMSAKEFYGRLRKVNPSPYLFLIDFEKYQLVGSSPESLIRVRQGVAQINPIAGTIRRGKTEAEDEMLKQQLSSDPKERAEHLMLVDLARNDLGRVSVKNSVTVPQFMECEPFSHLIHLVSHVEGKLREGVKPIQALRFAMPAGTVSGAPKISAMQILSGLEKTKRNFYAGALGYVQSNGDLDFCITLRSALYKDSVWNLQAGSGIVYDSNAEREFTETCEKLGALYDVLTK